MKKYFTFIFLTFTMFFLSSTALALDFEYYETDYTINNGLLSSQTLDIAQTYDGYIWIASYNGLTRYDSKDFTHYAYSNGFNSKTSTAVEEYKGTLFVGTQNAGIFYKLNNEFIQIESPTSSNYITSLFVYEDILYVGTNSGVFYIDSDFKTFEIEDLNQICVNRLFVSSEGIYIIDTSNNINLYHNNSLEVKYTAEGIYKDLNNNLWISKSDNKILKISNGIETEYQTITGVITFCEASDGRLYIGGEDGVAYFNGTSFKNITLNVSASIEKIIEDYEGNIWIASSRTGVAKIEKNKIVNETIKNNDASSSVNAIVEYNGQMYIGSDSLDGGKTLRVVTNNGLETNELCEIVGSSRVRALCVDDDNNLWVGCYGTLENTLLKYDGNTIVSYNASDIKSNKVRCIYSYNNRVYVGIDSFEINQAGVFYIENNTFSKVITTPFRPLCLYANDNGLYVGTDGDGVKFIDSSFNNWTNLDDAFSSKAILRISEYNDGLLIAYSSYLYYFKNGVVTEISGIPFQTSIFDILNDDEYIWILSSGTIYKVEYNTLTSNNVKYTAFDYRDGLNCDVTANSWSKIFNETLYICGGDGLYSLNANIGFEVIKEIKVDVNLVNIDNVAFSGNNIDIDKNANRITIDLKVLSFNRTNDIYVAYQLVGQDNNRIIVKYEDLNDITYTNLNGGSYTFKVDILDSSGNIISSYNDLLSINKEYKIFEYSWYMPMIIALSVLLVTILFIVFYYIRTKKLKAKNKENVALTYQTIIMMAKIIDAKDAYTRGHSIRVGLYTKELAIKEGLSDKEIHEFFLVGLLHDIGKIGIPDNILNKPGKLTNEEYEIVKKHVNIGDDIIDNYRMLSGFKDGVKYHHEKWDGSGYTSGLKGEEIPLIARYIALADTYDAMSSDRVYRKALPEDAIINELEKYKGIQFDPKLCEDFVELIKSGNLQKYHNEIDYQFVTEDENDLKK